MEYDEFPAMNTLVQVAAEGDLKDLQPGFERVRQFVEQSEERFSRFRRTSELTRLNCAAGTWFHASPEMFDLVESAFKMHFLTDGLFDPSILGALRQAGYNRSMDEIRQTGSQPACLDIVWITPPFGETLLDPETNAIYLPSGAQIDLGGIAKGWIATRAAELLLQYSDACAVSAGGDMALFGLPAGERAWEVSLEDPLDSEQVIAVLKIPPGGLATSTVTRRQWLQGGQIRHHIIDPRSQKPATSSWLSVSVYAKTSIYAEVFAKALLIAGPAQAQSLVSRINGLQYAAVDSARQLTGTLENMEMIYVSE